MEALERFHKQAVQHITRCHIWTDAQGVWTYPDTEVLLPQCRLWTINVYIEQRRGTLRKYLEEHKADLLADVTDLPAPACDLHQVLW